MDTLSGHVTEALLMSTHNVCFHGEIRKILSGYQLLSKATYIVPRQFFRCCSSLYVYCCNSAVMFCPCFFPHLFFFIALDDAFFQSKSIDIFLISLRKHMLWYSLEAPR